MEGLLLDIDAWRPQIADKQLVSIYFGGGTPSLLEVKDLQILIDKVKSIIPCSHDIEVTLEANPESVTLEKMREYRAAGVNRISIGVQSFDDHLLKKLGRTHHAKAAREAIEKTVAAGISNISVDLMYDIPGQTIDSWQETLKQVCTLPITHLSLYNLTIEPHTVFFKYREKLLKELPDVECSTAMYQQACTALEESGLKQYEISAFTRNNLYSRHNVGYWTARPFIGFGPSAFSYWQGKRFRAVANLNRYVEALRENRSPIDFSEELPEKEKRRELLAIALRLKCGVHLPSFEAAHGLIDSETRAKLYQLEEQGLLERAGDTVAMTNRGVLFYDTIATEII